MTRIRVGGGAGTIRQYLRERMIDELHIAIFPVLLGSGEPLLAGLDLRALDYECVRIVASEKATHVVLRRKERREPLHESGMYASQAQSVHRNASGHDHAPEPRCNPKYTPA